MFDCFMWFMFNVFYVKLVMKKDLVVEVYFKDGFGLVLVWCYFGL